MPTIETYNTIVTAAKDAARNERRTAYFLKLSGEIYRKEQVVEEVTKGIDEAKKSLAVINFEFSEINTAHPSYADFKKENEELNKCYESRITKANEAIKEVEKEIAEIVTKQKDTVDGKVKMDYDAILSRASELLSLRTESEFKSLKVSA